MIARKWWRFSTHTLERDAVYTSRSALLYTASFARAWHVLSGATALAVVGGGDDEDDARRGFDGQNTLEPLLRLPRGPVRVAAPPATA